MLKLHFKISKQPRYRDNWKLNFERVMRCAVLYNRLDMLKCIAELKREDPEWRWEPILMRLALKRDDIDFEILNWLCERLPKETHPLLLRDVMYHMKRGNLDVVQWLYERNPVISQEVVDAATALGHIRILEYFYEYTTKRSRSAAAENAARKGYLDVVKLIIVNQRKEMKQSVLYAAASHGQLEVVRYFIESYNTLDVPRVMDLADGGGSLSLIQYLGKMYIGGDTDQNQIQDFAPDALDRAVRTGNVEVVEFLHEKYTNLQCSTTAMDDAAGRGHLKVVKLLHFNRTEGCTAKALINAVSSFRYHATQLEMMKFLCENRSEGDVVAAMVRRHIAVTLKSSSISIRSSQQGCRQISLRLESHTIMPSCIICAKIDSLSELAGLQTKVFLTLDLINGVSLSCIAGTSWFIPRT